MSDELVISGGGTSSVAVDELFVDAATLGAAAAVVSAWADRLGAVRRPLEAVALPVATSMWDAASPTMALEAAERRLRRAQELAESLRAGLGLAAQRYGETERVVDRLWSMGAAFGAQWLGFAAPAALTGGVLAAAVNVAASAAWRSTGNGRTPLERWLGEHRALLSDPAFVRLVRLTADHADEFAARALHLPLPPALVAALGSGITAPDSAAALLGAAGAAGVLGSRALVEGPVQVERRGTRTVEAPSGIGELADRVPANGTGGAQVRVERYGPPDDARWIVYVGGTVHAGIVAGSEPFDMTSNLHGVAMGSGLVERPAAEGGGGAGERAVREALRAAGVAPGDPVLPVGYSGGGIVAASLAADPELNVVGAVNLGGPVAAAPTRDGVPVLSIEHDEDLVPASAGAGQPSAERLTVSRSVLDTDRRSESPLPAHELSRYRATAHLVDGSEEARLVEFRALVADVTGGAPGVQSEWRATRDVSREPTDGR